jgi:hypothetical protein
LVVAPQQIKSINVYITALPLLCAEQMSLCSSVTLNSINLVKQLHNLTAVLAENQRILAGKQDSDDSDEEEKPDTSKLSIAINSLSRRVNWLVGYISFGLIQVKNIEPTLEESKKETVA